MLPECGEKYAEMELRQIDAPRVQETRETL